MSIVPNTVQQLHTTYDDIRRGDYSSFLSSMTLSKSIIKSKNG
jgi:hypothetical protein